MIYQAPSTCPVCGTTTYVTVRVYGDSDCDETFITDTKQCETCAGIKIVSPRLYARMVDMVKKHQAEISACKKEMKNIEASNFSLAKLRSACFFNDTHNRQAFECLIDRLSRQMAGSIEAAPEETLRSHFAYTFKTAVHLIVELVAQTAANEKIKPSPLNPPCPQLHNRLLLVKSNSPR